tara:strand:- start:281 stop:1102 length:822 start_codon:yes stop_codon:yes gene_type:complete
MKLIENTSTKIMGVINGTPDSFYAKSRIPSDFTFNYEELSNCDIIDVGFESSRPYSKPISENEELKRLNAFIEKFTSNTIPLSIDTYKPKIAERALNNGFSVINDIKGGSENGIMFEIASSYRSKIIIMHMKGNPLTMQKKPKYENLIDEIAEYFDCKINLALSLGVKEDEIILDPGLGFGKTFNDNYCIINKLSFLKKFDFPILIGLSRKSFLSINNDLPDNRLPASLGAAALAVSNGADILRVHDVIETRNMCLIIDKILNKNKVAISYEA